LYDEIVIIKIIATNHPTPKMSAYELQHRGADRNSASPKATLVQTLGPQFSQTQGPRASAASTLAIFENEDATQMCILNEVSVVVDRECLSPLQAGLC
jgi:hypothetical protein